MRKGSKLGRPANILQETRIRRATVESRLKRAGLNNGRSKFSLEQVMEIRLAYEKKDERTGEYGRAILARKFGVVKGAITAVARGRTWKLFATPTDLDPARVVGGK